MKRIQSSDLRQIKSAMQGAVWELRWATKCIELNMLGVNEEGGETLLHVQDRAGKFEHMPNHKAFLAQYGISIEQMDEWIEWLE